MKRILAAVALYIIIAIVAAWNIWKTEDKFTPIFGNKSTNPMVIRPGQTFRIILGNVDAANNFWRGDNIKISETPLLLEGVQHLWHLEGCRSRSVSWGSHMTDRDSPPDGEGSHDVWVECRLPNDQSLAGRDLHFNISLDVFFPQIIKSVGSSKQTLGGHITTVYSTFANSSKRIESQMNVRVHYLWQVLIFYCLKAIAVSFLVLICLFLLFSVSQA